MTDSEILLVAVIATPLAILSLVGLLRGYHMNLYIWKGGHQRRHDEEDDEHGND